MSYRYLKRQRLTKADEFSSVFSLGRSIHSRYLQIIIYHNALTYARMGLVVSKRVARQAVKRNYMKRVIREYFRHHEKELGNIDLVVRVKRPFGWIDREAIAKELYKLWSKVEKCPDS